MIISKWFACCGIAGHLVKLAPGKRPNAPQFRKKYCAEADGSAGAVSKPDSVATDDTSGEIARRWNSFRVPDHTEGGQTSQYKRVWTKPLARRTLRVRRTEQWWLVG